METQQQIIQSLFSHRGQDGQLDETYIAHVKIWEDVPVGSGQPDEGSKKARYLMLSVSKYGKVFLHKAKRNNNGSFSKGKTWNLEDLRQVEVVTPQTFALSMTSRTYIWQTERPRDQQVFLATTCKIYRKYTQGRLPALLNLNFTIDDVPTESISPQAVHAQPTLYHGGAPSASSSSLAAPPLIRSRQGSHSSIASSQMTNQESHYAAPPNNRPRPSVGSSRAEGSFSSQNRPMDVHREGPYGSPAHTHGQPVQQYTPVPGMGRQMSDPYEVSPVQSHGRRDFEDVHSRSHSGGLNGSYNEHPHGHQQQQQQQQQGMGMGMGMSPTQNAPHFPPLGSSQSSFSHSNPLSPLAERPSGLGSRNVSEQRTPTQATYGFREQAIPPPTVSQIPPVQPSQPMQTPSQSQSRRSQEVDTPAAEDGYASESAMLTPVPATSSGFEQPLIPPVVPKPRNDGIPPRSEERKRAMLPPIVTNPSTSNSNLNSNSTNGPGSRPPTLPERHQVKREPEFKQEKPVVKEVKQVKLPPEETDEEPDREPQPRARRASFVAPPTTTPYSRDMLLRAGSFAQAEALLEQDDADGEEMEDATMANVEEILEGFDWGNHGVESSGSYRQGAEAIESRLLDELNALEAANIHAFLESDDRIQSVLKGINDAIAEMDEMDTRITGYKMQLGGVTEDIAFIESQNRGLQVQTANQQALLKELEQLLENVSVDPTALRSLTQESLETERGIANLESALSTLYKALLAIRDRDTNDMAAAAGRKDEYETHNRQFCLRLVEYLMIMIKFQAETSATAAASKAASGEIPPHAQMEQKLGMYCGLILYMIEMDEERYQKLCTNYFSTAAELHTKEMKGLFMALIGKLKKPTEEKEDESSFISAAAISTKSGAMQRSRTVMGNLRGGDKKDKRGDGAEMKATEALDMALQTIAIQLGREEAFISDFLHITDSMLTYADYMDLDSYFRRQAVRYTTKGFQPPTVKLRRSALDLIFGFVSGELKDWVDAALQRDRVQVFGMMAVCEKAIQDAEDRSAIFYLNILQRQMQRLQGLVERYIADQVKAIENAQLSNRKRRGVVFFIKHFPVFVSKVEAQLIDYDDFAARSVANAGYEKIVNTMLDTLQHMAKMDRSDVAGEDKGQLNHSIIMIENLHFYVQDAAKHDIPALHSFMERAKSMYDENMTAYIRAVLRRSFGRPWDFFEAVQKQLRASSAQEISSSPSYNKAALKRAVKDISSGKEMRKAVEALVKRIEKHYSLDESDLAGTDDATAMSNEAVALIGATILSCEKLLVAEVGKWSALMGQCYAEAAASGVGLEYGPGDVEGAFKKAKA